MTAQHLLFELGSEELPPKSLLKLSQALHDHLVQGLRDAQLTFTGSKAYATPRRLAVLIENLESRQPDSVVEKRGPAIQAAFTPDGKPSKAAEGFAASCGATFEQLERLKTDKGEWLIYKQAVTGQPVENLLPDIVRKSIAGLPIAKRMRWGNRADEFVRPVHWAVLMYGKSPIACQILGLTTGTETRGHRFHAPSAIVIEQPENYGDILFRHGKVIAGVEQRKLLIREKAESAAQTVGGFAHIEDDLLEEVAALNEWPVPITGSFDQRFLALPAEVLITTMQTNQKYFPVKNKEGALLPYFITFSNIESTRPDSIKQGNERVITPRLTDAEFFWKQDRKVPLAERVDTLKNIVFQIKLGTLAEKNQRVVELAETIAVRLGANVEWTKRAALLAKADLLTNMVNEFDNLQGIMGRYYALADGEAGEVALAIEEHYYPKHSGGPTPSTLIGQAVALADKVDTLCGIFSAGLIPTGDKDPYALRRAAIGVLRILIENGLELDIVSLVEQALNRFNHSFDKADTQRQVVEFIFDRLKGYSLDKGFGPDEFESVLAVNPTKPLDFYKRLQAIKSFRQLPEAESLAAANKRIRNILKKSETEPSDAINALALPEEQRLLESAQDAATTIAPFLAVKDYQGALSRLAQTETAVNAFFETVMVMTDDLNLRAQRLGLLNRLSEQFLQIADISKLQN